MSAAEIVEKFREFAQGVGIDIPGDIIADGRIHRAGAIGYIIHADEQPAGQCWDFRVSEKKHSWRADAAGAGTPQAPHIVAARAADRAEKREQEKADALPRLRELWASAAPAPADHAYLVSHGIGGREDIAGLLRIDKSGALLVPFHDGDPGALTGIQIIQPAGRKWFLPGSTYARRFLSFPGATDTIYIAEGMATAAAVAISTGKQAYATGGAGNMPGVAAVIRSRYPDAIIVIAGDHDRGNIDPTDTDTDSRPRNTGREAAEKAAAACGGIAIIPADIPDFAGSDWADVLVQFGPGEVRERLTPTREMLTRAEKPGEEGPTNSYTDLGNSRRFVAKFGKDIRYIHAFDRWLIWRGDRWEIDEAEQVMGMAREIPAIIAEEAAAHYRAAARARSKEEREARQKQAEAALKGATKAEGVRNIKNFLELAQSERGMSVRPDALDTHHHQLNVANGTIDLRTGELHPHRREDYHTRIAPYHYDPNATCPRWEQAVLDFCSGDAELAFWIQRAVGYSLSGDVSEQCFFVLHGMGSNGKSFLLKIIQRLAGGYGQSAKFETFLEDERGSNINNDVAVLRGARLVVSSEAPEGKRLAEHKIKHLTGGDKIRARFLYKESFEFDPTFKIWLGSNHRPKITGTDNGIWRRVRLIPCKAWFDQNNPDPTFGPAIEAEMPGILTWAVKGAVQWYRHRLGIPSAVTQATDRYREEMDSIGAWLAECCDTSNPTAKVGSKNLYQSYATWAEAAGEGVLAQKNFNRVMGDRGWNPHREGPGMFFPGISLLPT